MAKKSPKSRHRGTRITVTIPPEDYDRLCTLARSKKVSNAWVVRDAVEKYLSADLPLFTEGGAK